MFSGQSGDGRRDSVIITTSWDDGDPLDWRLAGLLAKHGLPATFYIPLENPERPVMPPPDIRRLAAAGFEIGSHTFHHCRLLNLPLTTARGEIVTGKAALEDLLGRPVLPFCYVGGECSQKVATLVREAGFAGARTAVLHRLWKPSRRADRFAMPTTVLARNLTRRDDAYQLLRWKNLGALPRLLEANTAGFVDLAGRWLEFAMDHGGVYHLWGHSWEIECFDAWAKLETVLAMIAGTKGQARWLTNGELFAECAANAAA